MKFTKQKRIITCLLAALTLLFSGCAEGNAEPKATIAPVVEAGAFAQGSNAALSFALLSSADRGGNELVNTAGLTGVLAAVKNGTDGETDRGLEVALGTQELSIRTVNERAVALRNALSSLRNGRFATAWGLFVGENQALKEDYLIACAQELQLHAVFRQLDVSTGNAVLGSWADDNTGGRIKQVEFAFGDLSAPLFVDIVTADPDWQQALNPARTKALPFHTEDNEDGAVPTLVCMQNSGVYRGDAGSLAVLPTQEDETRLVILMPPEGVSVGDFLPTAAAKHDQWLELATWEEQRVLLPRATLKSEGSAVETLAGAGFDIFSADANHDDMGIGLAPVDALQQATLIIDESGLEEADQRADYSADDQDGIKTLAIDRPYIVLLEHTGTGTILLAGIVRDPLAATGK